MNKDELNGVTGHLKQIIGKVAGEVGRLDKDLTDEKKAERAKALWDAESKTVHALLTKLNGAIDGYRKARQDAVDGQKQMLIKAVRETDKATVGDLILSQALPGMSMKELEAVIGLSPNPLLIMAARSEVVNRDVDITDKQSFLKVFDEKAAQFPDTVMVKHNARLEFEALQTLKAYQDATEASTVAKMDIGHQLAAVEPLI